MTCAPDAKMGCHKKKFMSRKEAVATLTPTAVALRCCVLQLPDCQQVVPRAGLYQWRPSLFQPVQTGGLWCGGGGGVKTMPGCGGLGGGLAGGGLHYMNEGHFPRLLCRQVCAAMLPSMTTSGSGSKHAHVLLSVFG
jgi:hypothetical protein